MRIAIIDNYDSFTYNLAHLVKAIGVDVDVLRNDCFELHSLATSFCSVPVPAYRQRQGFFLM